MLGGKIRGGSPGLPLKPLGWVLMLRKTISFDTARGIGLALPDVEEGSAYGSPALKVRGKMFACLAIHRSAEPDSLSVRIGFDERDALIASDPSTYYLTDHYVNYPVVLVRLTRVHDDALRDLLRMAWRFAWQPRRATRRKADGQRRNVWR
jgi:hypothetical protein